MANFGLLQNIPMGQTQVGQPLPIAQPQASTGGDDLFSDISGLLGGMKSLFGNNPVSQANSAISQSMASAGPQQVAQSLMPQSVQQSNSGPIQQGNLPVYGSNNGSYPISQPQYQANTRQMLQGMLQPKGNRPLIGQPNMAQQGTSFGISQPQYQLRNQALLNSKLAVNPNLPNPFKGSSASELYNNQTAAEQFIKNSYLNDPKGPTFQDLQNIRNNFGNINSNLSTTNTPNSIWNNAKSAGISGSPNNPMQQFMAQYPGMQNIPNGAIYSIPNQGSQAINYNQPVSPASIWNSLKTPQQTNNNFTKISAGSISNPYYGNANYPLNIRSNNPGNIMGSNGKPNIYPTMEAGIQAQSQLIDTYAATGRNTPTTMIKGTNGYGGWSTTDQAEYIKGLSKAAGVGPNDPINFNDPNIKAKVMQYQMQMEGGNKLKSPLYSEEQVKNIIIQQQKASSIAYNSNNPQVQQQAIQKATQTAASNPNDYYKIASSYMGYGRQNHPEILSNFFKKSGQGNLNIQNTPWCAEFANSVIAAGGGKGTNSLSARSFLGWGIPTSNPTQGDVVVFKDMTGNNSPIHGHVGFYDGMVTRDGIQYVRSLGGNQSGQVSIKEYPVSAVLGYRQPPSSQEISQNPMFASKAVNWNSVKQGAVQGIATNPMINPVGAAGGIHSVFAKTPNLPHPQAPFQEPSQGINPTQLEPNEYEELIKKLDQGHNDYE